MNIGDYVRTTSGKIYKITDFKKYYINWKLIIEKQLVYIDNRNSCLNYEQFCKLIIKNSPNIMDLIEVGDYVNGNPVCLIKEDEHNRKWIYTDSNYKCGYLEEDIETILTHEQFKKMEYKIGD